MNSLARSRSASPLWPLVEIPITEAPGIWSTASHQQALMLPQPMMPHLHTRAGR